MLVQRSEHGTWVSACPQCDNQWYIQNHAWVVVDAGGKPTSIRCANCQDPAEASADDDITVNAELGWCECGMPSRIDDLMEEFLAGVERRWAQEDAADAAGSHHATRYTDGTITTFPYGMNEDVAYLLAYLADTLGWTEHGGSVGGEWLTHDGKEALANLRRCHRERSDHGD